MNLFGIEIANSTIQEGIVYLLDPDNRILLIGIGIVIILFVVKLIFKSIKRLLFIAVIIGVMAYFYLKFATNGA